MNFWKIAGGTVLASPFVALALAEAHDQGWWAVAQTWGIVLGSVILFFAGIVLWERGTR